MRIMRLLVYFDLPTISKKDRREYARFRKFLVADGYRMEQYSVYSRILMTRDSAETHLKRLKGNLPPVGAVTVLTLTEKQYESRQILMNTSPRTHHQAPDAGTQLTLAF